MKQIIELNGMSPSMGTEFYIAPGAFIVGDVVFGDYCSVWFNAVVRGDVNFIRIGNRVNIQDGAIIHGTYQQAGTTIGNSVTISHRAIIHGCTIHDGAMIGMGAIIMDNAVIEEGSLVAAGALVLEKTIVERGYIYAGSPARKLKPIDETTLLSLNKAIAEKYIMYSKWYRNSR